MSQRFFKRSRGERDNALTTKRSFNEADYEVGSTYDKLADDPSIVSAASDNVEHAPQNPSVLSKSHLTSTSHASSSTLRSYPSMSSTHVNGKRNGIASGHISAPAAARKVPVASVTVAGKSSIGVKCSRRPVPAKDYQVVSNVKESDVVHELGEKQAFNSDLQYYFDMIEQTTANTTLTRSLATMQLSKKLVDESFESTFSAMDGLRVVLLKLSDSAKDASGCLELAYAVFIWVLVVKYNRTLGRSIWCSLLQGCDMEHSQSITLNNAAPMRTKTNTASALPDHYKVVVRAKEIFVIMKPYMQTLRKGSAVHDIIKQCDDTERVLTAADVFHDILLHIDISRHSVRSVEFLREEASLDSLIALAASQIVALQDLLEKSDLSSTLGYVESMQYETRLIRLLNIIERYLQVLTVLCSEHEDATAHFITKSSSLMLQQIDWLLHTGVECCVSNGTNVNLVDAARAAVQPKSKTRATKLQAVDNKADLLSVPLEPSSLTLNVNVRSVAVITAWQGVLHEACNVIRSAVSCCDLWRTTVGDIPHCIPAIIACCLLVPGALSGHQKSSLSNSKQSSPSSSQNAAVADHVLKVEAENGDQDIVVISPKLLEGKRRAKMQSRPPAASNGRPAANTHMPIQRYDEHHDYKLEGVAAVALCNLCDGNAMNRQTFLDYRRAGVVDDPVKAFVALLRRRCVDSLHHNQTLEEQRSEMTEERLGRHGEDVSQESIFRAVNKALEHADAAVDSTAISTYIGYFFAYMVKDDASLAERILGAWNSERDEARDRRTTIENADGSGMKQQHFLGEEAGDNVEFNILNIFDIMERFEQFLLLTKLSSHDDISNMTEIRQHFKALIEASM